MPNIWTHMLFSEDMMDALGKPQSIPKHAYIINIGAQGPDPFFYYNFWPWIKEEPVHKIGNLLHTENCGAFLMDMIVSAKNQTQVIQSYVFGFVTHHILDRNAHPYIHYRAGYEGNKHQLLEVIIDTLMMERYKNLKTWKTPVYKEIHLNRKEKKEISEFLFHVIKRNYPKITQPDSHYIKKSFDDMKLALTLLADPYGWKNKILKSMISSFSHQPIINHKDYLNLEHQTWFHPATNEPSKKSFIDLYEQARIEGNSIMKKVIDYWHDNGTNQEEINELIRDISYDTGLPLHLNLQNVYSDPIV